MMLNRFSKIIGALALAAVLAACSAVKLGYNALDDLGYWWLDGYAGFTDDQAPRIRGEIDRLHTWHRTKELPRIADLLARIEQIAPGNVTAQQACAFVPDIMARLYATWEQAEPTAAALALQMTPEQVKQLQRKYAENNRKFRKEWIDVGAAEQKDKRIKQIVDRLEMVYGELGEPQVAVIRAGIAASMFDPQRMLTERQRRQQELLQLLRKLAGSGTAMPEARAQLRGYLNRVFESPDAAYRAYQLALQQEGCRLAASVHETTTPAQREQAVKRLRAYQKDLRDLAAAQQ